MVTDILSSSAARKLMKEGVDCLADSVKVTLGAKGRNVIIRNERTGEPRVTKDGVSVAKVINLPDKFKDMGAQLIKAAAVKTGALAGDGTTTSTLLAQKIIAEGMRVMEENSNPIDVKKGIDKAVIAATSYFKAISRPVTLDSTELLSIATISANNDPEMGGIVSQALRKVGADGVVTHHQSKTAETYVEIVDGLQIDKGYITPYFVNKREKMTAEHEDPIIVLYERKISTFYEIELVLALALKNSRPLLIIAEDIDGEALATLITNRHRQNSPFVAIKLPSFGGMQKQMLEDIAVLTGGTVVSPDKGETLRTICATSEGIKKYCGGAEKIVVSATTTNIFGGKGKKSDINAHIEQVKALIADSKDEFTKDRLKKERLAKLSNGVGCIYVGATTEVELLEKKDRIDDALCATKAALAEGILPGGGVAYLRAVKSVENLVGLNPDEQKGIDIIKIALQEPIRQMAANAGLTPITLLNKLEEKIDMPIDFGYNFKTDEYELFFDTGILDPAKVTRIALENAASVAAMFLTTECAIVDYVAPLQQPK